jgi:hypothetical protein
MQSYLEGRINSFTANNGIHVAYVSGAGSECMDSHHLQGKYWRELLIRNGIVEDLRDIDHIALFMFRCRCPGQRSLISMRLFLDLGMEPNTIDRTNAFEHNALHMVLYGGLEGRDRESTHHFVSERKILEEKLVTLIEAGTAIHHRNCHGFTPSLYARAFNCWDEWCQALGRAGLTIEDALQEENNEWLQEAGWEEGMIALQ